MTTVSQKGGLAKVEELFQDQERRARELKSQGTKIVGYYCCYPPLELLAAADVLPYRIMGDMGETITRADTYLETIMCSYVRSSFDLALKGHYDFFDGYVCPHTCDTIERMYNIWRYYLKPEFSHFVNIPHRVDDYALKFLKAEFVVFRKKLEEWTGKEISDDRLRNAVALYNESRGLVRRLYDLRKPDPPLISGTEILKTIVAGARLPVAEFNALLKEVIEDASRRPNPISKKDVRVLLYSSEMDDTPFIKLIEDAGANVVMDDICLGTRPYWHDVPVTDDPLDGLAQHYLRDIRCPRSYRRQTEESREVELELRFSHIKEFIKDFNVDAVIMYIIRFCDTHELEVPDLRDYIQKEGIPVLHLEDDYSARAVGQLRTRVDAFLEMINPI